MKGRPVAEEEWLTAADICARLKVHENTVRGWPREGRLAGINFGGKVGWRIRRSAFEDFIRDMEGKEAAA
jgi:excisionase family DNA binding protein